MHILHETIRRKKSINMTRYIVIKKININKKINEVFDTLNCLYIKLHVMCFYFTYKNIFNLSSYKNNFSSKIQHYCPGSNFLNFVYPKNIYPIIKFI